MAYAHPEVLVTTDWVHQHLTDPKVRFVEVDVDVYSYNEGHIPGAVSWDWQADLCDVVLRDILSPTAMSELLERSGIFPGDTIVVYGDNNNWFAAWAFWQLKIYGHQDVRILDGGRRKWLEEGRSLTDDVPAPLPSKYPVGSPDFSIRAFLADVITASAARSATLIDVRSHPEFTGELLAPAGLPETCQRGGHIPGASSVPWALACRPDGTFKSPEELQALYGPKGVALDRPAIVYCRIGERSSHTWFALKYLLGVQDVRNYDGSWTEWGNLVRAPIER